MSKNNLKKYENWIKKAWIKTGLDFLKKGRNILWKEASAIKYPFFLYLECLRKEYKIGENIVVIPEYRPTVPNNAKCKNENCNCSNNYKKNEEIDHIDICIVKFSETLPKDVKSDDTRSLWCFEHQPIIAMEFKWSVEYNKKTKSQIEKDIGKLRRIIKRGCKLAYFCDIYNSEIEKSNGLRFVKELVKNNKKFRIPMGSYKYNSWKIHSVN